MIIDDEHDLTVPIQDVVEASTPTIEVVVDENLRFAQFLARHKKIRKKIYIIEHLWEQRNDFEN